ncbi:hypothetical protein PO124_21565 [Bacillus licheniformis]|nr:hypothetical protein [Bacillus licheniformis]
MLVHTAVPAIPALAAYTDTSVYKIETAKEFNSESEALKAAEQLKRTRDGKPRSNLQGKRHNIRLTSEGVEGESRAKSALQFEKKPV